MRNDLTIIYYTNNREDPDYEFKVRNHLVETAKGLPIISVSHKPIELGKNICVGEVGSSDWNIAKQIYIGCERAKTKYVAMAEADCVYPPTGYFDFVPPSDETAYRFDNIWILFPGSGAYRHKEYSLCGMISNRELLMRRIESRFKRKPRFRVAGGKKDIFYKRAGWVPFTGPIAIINMKTGGSMRKFSGTDEKSHSLPYWGKTSHLEKEFRL